MAYPPLRYIDAVQIEHEGEQMVLLRDPEGLCTDTLIVPLPLFLIMSLLDGRRDGPAIQDVVAHATGGQLLPLEDLERIVGELDSYYLLQNERSRRRRQCLEQEFAERPTRPAIHAGAAYPAESEACRELLGQFFAGLAGRNGHATRPRGLVAPHIDLRVGGQCLAEAFARLDPLAPPRLYIILGVAHHPAKNLFTLTDKSFETPLGLVQTDQQAAKRLRELYGAARLDGEYVHKNEHSVEFPALMLRYHHDPQPDFKILPILCGSLHEEYGNGGVPPVEAPDVREFVLALRRLIEEYQGDVCVIASVDLSHVGRKFGDEEGVDDERAMRVRVADGQMLTLIESMDAEGFFNHFRPDANVRNVDAVTAVYVMMHTLGKGRGEKIQYQQWRETETDSMVTYASLAIY